MAMSPKALIQKTSGQYWQHSGMGWVREEEVGDGVGEEGGEGWWGGDQGEGGGDEGREGR